MNDSPRNRNLVVLYAVAIVGTFLIAAGLVWLMIHYTQPQPVGAERSAERRKALAELRAQDSDVLGNYAWHDQSKGIVRLPIQRAMELTIREYKNPQAARSNLIFRVEEATAVPPPPPEAPSIYE